MHSRRQRITFFDRQKPGCSVVISALRMSSMSIDQSIAKQVRQPAQSLAKPPGELGESTVDFLMKRYGPLLNAKALAETLHYPGQLALERSMQRGHLKLRTFHLPGRRGVFAHASDVAGYITQLMENAEESIDGAAAPQPSSIQPNRRVKGARTTNKAE